MRFGDHAEEIIKYIEFKPVDMVAMTTHWRTGIQKLIFGSVARRNRRPDQHPDPRDPAQS